MNEITKKYNEDPNFHAEMIQAQKKYDQNIQRAIYSTFTIDQEEMLVPGGFDQQGDAIFLVFGIKQEGSVRISLEKYFLYHLNIFEQFFEKNKCKFTVIFFNSLCVSSNPYSNFRGIYRSLPLKYFQNLKRLLVVHPSFMVKTLDWMVTGTINKYLKSKTQYLENIQELAQYKIKLSKGFLEKIRQDIRIVDYPKPKSQSKISQIIQNPQPKLGLKARSEIIGFPVRQIEEINIIQPQKPKKIDPTKRNLHQYEITDIGIPLLLKMMVMYLQLKPEFLEQEGIFRKAVSIDDEQQAISYLYFGKYQFLNQITNPHIVACLIKKFFANLIQPLFSFEAYELLAKDKGMGNDVESIKAIVNKLPQLNYITLMFLLNFFRKEVISRQSKNKMSEYNVAVVLLPCLMHSRNSGIEDLMYSKKLAMVLENIIRNFDMIFGDRKEQKKLYRKTSKQSQMRFEKDYIQPSVKSQLKQINQISQQFKHGN